MSIREQEVISLVHSLKLLIADRKRAAQVQEKGLADFVTQVDLSVQHELAKALGQRWPEIQFMGEEEGAAAQDTSKPMWILDPIDGTTNLIHDYHESAVSLALWDGSVVVMGVVYNPFTGETYSATRGHGARLNGKTIHVSKRPDLAHSLSIFGTSPYHKEWADKVFGKAKALYLRSEDLRRGGSAALDLCKIAAGRAEVYFEYDLKPWDYAAGMLIVKEAGGVCTDFDGSKLPVVENGDILATNGIVHGEAVELLAEE
ncbi:MAG: inositol monophosphatase [Oscillospiraceae bacterium]|nr:inositol monophosphatase [Oscillospiraceae bacterium]